MLSINGHATAPTPTAALANASNVRKSRRVVSAACGSAWVVDDMVDLSDSRRLLQLLNAAKRGA
jgi:hypothetical protein